MWDGFRRGVGISANDRCYGTREYRINPKTGQVERGKYVWMTYNEAHDEALTTAAGLKCGCNTLDRIGCVQVLCLYACSYGICG